MTDEAAFLISQQVATLRALPGQVLGQAILLKLGFVIVTHVFFQNAGNSISTG